MINTKDFDNKDDALQVIENAEQLVIESIITEKTAKDITITEVIGETASSSSNNKDPEDDFETFLYGKSPSRPKAAPKKKMTRLLSHSKTINTSNDTTAVSSNPCESPAHQFLTPGLTFDSTSWSPSSHQRDLLSVARDIADFQKSIAAGKKLDDSVSNTILFTKP